MGAQLLGLWGWLAASPLSECQLNPACAGSPALLLLPPLSRNNISLLVGDSSDQLAKS